MVQYHAPQSIRGILCVRDDVDVCVYHDIVAGDERDRGEYAADG